MRTSGGAGATGNDPGLKTYIRADEENKQEEVGEYIDVYDGGGTMMFNDPDAFK